MAGISMTGAGLPPAATSSLGTAAPVAPTALQPAGGVGNAGSGTMTEAQAAQPHPTYSGLLAGHVALLEAAGTPSAVISQLDQSRPQAEAIERYLQGEIMQNPEGWDTYLGNPAGTARAGLQRMLPGVVLPAPGAGNPGYLADGSHVSGINVPGVTQPLLGNGTGTPQANQGDGLMKGLGIAAVIAGVAFVGYKLFKGKKADAADAGMVKAMTEGFGAVPGVAGGGGLPGMGGLDFSGLFSAVGGKGKDAITHAQALQLMTMQTVAAGGAAGTHVAATNWATAKGLGPGDGYLQSVVNAARYGGIDPIVAHGLIQENLLARTIRAAVDNKTIGDVAASQLLAAQLRSATAGAATPDLTGIRDVFKGVAGLLGG